MEDKKFWMVWNPSGAQPRHQHGTEHEATKEAERLARCTPGQRFYVLEAIMAREVNAMQKIELKGPGEPPW